MVTVLVNGHQETPRSIEEFGVVLDRVDSIGRLELWLNASSGPAVSMLRHGDHAFLMYLRHSGDSGFVSYGGEAGSPVQYTLSNGQIDEYPRSWCIPLEDCYKALAYFFVNEGQQPSWISWRES